MLEAIFHRTEGGWWWFILKGPPFLVFSLENLLTFRSRRWGKAEAERGIIRLLGNKPNWLLLDLFPLIEVVYATEESIEKYPFLPFFSLGATLKPPEAQLTMFRMHRRIEVLSMDSNIDTVHCVVRKGGFCSACIGAIKGHRHTHRVNGLNLAVGSHCMGR